MNFKNPGNDFRGFHTDEEALLSKHDFSVTRRDLLTGMAVAALTPVLARAVMAEPARLCDGEVKPPALKPHPQRAVSLRQISDALGSGKPARFEGLTRLEGYVVDRDNHDVILWGLAERDQPELQIQDFVVALRSAYDRYTIVRDGVTYRVSPLISIDPDVEVLRKLRGIDLFADDADERHAELCGKPQTVRVEGMPRDTRVAKVLIDADYRMKMVSQGIEELPIDDPFPSAFGARVEKWRRDAARGKKARGSNTRYWFQPDVFSYQVAEDGETVFLDRAKVVLRDEDQIIHGGALAASGGIDEIARAFACSWSDRMDDVYKAEALWRDMYNIFRHFAVAKIMRDHDAFLQAGLSAGVLLDSYALPTTKVPKTLAGLGRIEEVTAGRSRTRLANEVCGGVSVGFDKPLEKTADNGQVRQSGDYIVGSRPNLMAASWTVNQGAVRVRPAIARSEPAPAAKQPSLSDLVNHKAAPAPLPKAPTLSDLIKSRMGETY
ncbi:MAG: DUF1598 domain-containing protein [Rhodomicrobium sp.]